MKIAFMLLLFFLNCNCFSQLQESFVEMADGTKLKITSAEIDGYRKKIVYKLAGEEKEIKAKYKAVKSVSYAGYVFRIFKIKNKYEGFYIMTESKQRILGFREFEKTANKGGGFESTFKHIDFAIFDTQGHVLERQDLKETNNAKNIETREKMAVAIRTHFANCPKVLERLSTYYLPNDKNKKDLLNFFGKPEDAVSCK